MRLVCAYTDLRPATRRAVAAWPDREFVYVGGDDYEYGRLLRELWEDGETVYLCEHDMVPTLAQLEEIAACSCDYGCFPYAWTTCVGPAMGATKFSADLMATYPDVMEIACRIPSNYGEPGHWRQLDVWVQAAVLRDWYGEQPHVHLPPVTHLNEAQKLLDIHRDKPIVTSVQGRTYLPPGLVASIAAELLADSREHGT